MALEERLAALEEALPRRLEAAGTQEEPPRALAAQDVADVVAGDRRCRRRRYDRGQLELPLGGEHGAGDESRLPRQRDSGRLAADE